MRSERWNDAFLESMREVGDPEADAVIGDVVAHHGIAHVNDLMRSLVQNDEIVTGDFPPAVRDYLAESATLPPWADMAMIERGEQFFDDNWPIIVTLLFCASLPSAYAAHKGAQVLHLTQRMTQHVHRRIFETAQFVLDVMAPDGLSRTDRGIRSAQKVRLMHSATRNIIEHDPRWRSQWNEAWGVPINQEDMAGTLMTFSLQVLVGMKRFRIEMDPEDEEAYLHAWKVVGHILGVDEALLPSDLEDAQLLATTIFERQKGSSEAGLEL
ncbi:MAG TPA: oxygenase MpaB family protein, partial [Candidatus Binatia bacterium]|nr:oxygenase MpaB family protein [Candidatus Binatia bacterium]